MAEHNELGKRGEKIAESFLLQKGYQLLAKNYRFKHLELDLIFQDDDTLIVVEVKTRASDFMAGPEITVSKKKQKDIVKVANEFIIDRDLDLETRFDIVSIILNEREQIIDHIEDAFYPSM